MTKHQTCRECKCSFVGPDIGIGENLCESCGQEMYGERDAEIARLKADLAKFRHTKDGVVIVPGMTVYVVRGEAIYTYGPVVGVVGHVLHLQHNSQIAIADWDMVFSSTEAAEIARAKP